MVTATNHEPRTTNTAEQRAAAIRHAVYRDLLEWLPIASYDQARQFIANLRLVASYEQARQAADAAGRERQINAALMRFITLRVTPDMAECSYRGMKLPELEKWFNRRYGQHLQHVAGFHRRDEAAPFRLNLPFKCALYGYRLRGFYTGILCQPLDRLNTYFLLSSAKYDGPRAVPLQPRDKQYFTQFEEVE